VYVGTKQVSNSGVKVEFLQTDQRLDPGGVRIRVGGAIDLQAAAGNLEPFDQGNT